MAKIAVVSTHRLDSQFPADTAQSLLRETHFRIFECNNSFNGIDQTLTAKHADVLLARVSGTNQLQKIRKIIISNPHLKVVITGEKDQDVIFEYIRIGVKGHLGTDISADLLKRAIRVLHQGEVWFDRGVSSRVVDLFAGRTTAGHHVDKSALLSDREMEVLECVARGMKNRAIAEALHISESTVKTHLYKIYDKLGVKDRMSAVLKMKEW